MVAQHVTVSGRNMEVGEAMSEHVLTQMAFLSEKYFGKLVDCRVVFTKHAKGHAYTCNIGVQVGRDMHYDGEAQFDNPRTCFNQAFEHIAKQLRRRKRALHEDKPNGHAKEWVFNELSRPDFETLDGSMLIPIDGEDLSIDDGKPEDCAKV